MRKRERKAMIERYLAGSPDDEVDVTRFVEHEVDLAVRRARRKWLLEIAFDSIPSDKLIEQKGARKLRDKIVKDLRMLSTKHFKPWTETLALRYERGEEGQT